MATQTANLVWQELLQDDDGRRGGIPIQQVSNNGGGSRSSNSINNNHDRINYQGEAASAASQPPRRTATRKQKAVAACSGAIVTSLLMTPFDVIKTRIQTQSSPEPLFRPSSHITTPLKASSEPSTSRHKLPPSARTHAATCCQQTFFTGNPHEDKLTCKFGPSADQVKGSKQPPVLNNFPSTSSTSSALRHAAQHHRPPRTLSLPAASSYAPTTAVWNSSSVVLATSHEHSALSAACAFPDRGAAALQLDAATRQNRLTGMWDGVVKVSRAQGVRGLWRGLSPTLVMTVPSQVTYMTCYDVFRSHFLALEQKTLGPPSGSQPAFSNITSQTLFASLASGALARSVSATLVTPLELIRTRLQASDVSHSLSSIVLSLSRQVSASGPSVLFRGLSSTLWRDVPFSAIYFMGYETMKRMLTGGNGLGEGGGETGGLQEFGVAFLSGSASGSVAAVATHPFDLVKTRLQASSAAFSDSKSVAPVLPSSHVQGAIRSRTVRTAVSSSTLPALRTILQEEGVPGLFRGLTPRVAKVAPACGLMIGSYEAVGHFFSKAQQEF